MKNVLAMLLLVLGGCTGGKTDMGLIFGDPSSRGYSQRVEYPGEEATMVFISGQIPVDESGAVIGKDDLEKQTDQVFRNILQQVEKAGGSVEDVVKINCYFKDISQIALFRNARDRYINLERPPASTALQIARFIHPDVLIEIEAIAIVPKKK